jgi:3-hydroxyisobutyrate dehydrogenase
MAARLLAAQFPVTVYNRNPEKTKPLAGLGARVAPTPRAAAEGADVILSMLADDNASRSLWLGPDGALAAAAPGTLCIECSTVTVRWVQELAAAVAARCSLFLDTPVTGSKTHAAAGELSFLVGGSTEALEKARPVLTAMSKSITHLGPAGSGALLKLINNFLCGVQVASLAEALAMIEHSDLNRDTALGVLTNGAPGSPLIKTVAGRMTVPDYTPNFLLRLMAKDLTYALEEGAHRSVPLTTAAAALSEFQTAIRAGHGEQDIAAVIEPLRKL